jgi:hypothetical protein
VFGILGIGLSPGLAGLLDQATTSLEKRQADVQKLSDEAAEQAKKAERAAQDAEHEANRLGGKAKQAATDTAAGVKQRAAAAKTKAAQAHKDAYEAGASDMKAVKQVGRRSQTRCKEGNRRCGTHHQLERCPKDEDGQRSLAGSSYTTRPTMDGSQRLRLRI